MNAHNIGIHTHASKVEAYAMCASHQRSLGRRCDEYRVYCSLEMASLGQLSN